ncbi:uncharacterized protein LOC131077629 isoform X1 [Cryptomeria japonica]|uniref:uncharacterized protein LOC131077629 isoform X1 n=1 Tax=Cryptomeria japonica TaxID=3369 RepID=UPI0025AC2E85|nr:uncharacterized protein LOC131077629 isoform X1 [Cryptomeria japonica]
MSLHNNGAKRSNSNQNGSKNQNSGVPRPTQPSFLARVELTQEEEELNPTKDDFNACIDSYSRLNPDVNKDIQHKVSKLSLPTFDGSGEVTAQAWVQKLDTYLSLSPMTEDEAIKFAILHFNGIAHEWWQHELIVQGHPSMVTYADFAQRLIDRFDSNDPELRFKELAQLKQRGSIEEYVAEFQRISVMVRSVTEMTLMFLFIEGLSESLRGLVRTFELTSL